MSDFKVWLNGLTSKATPVDADVIPIRDSVSATTQKLSWANLKATLATWINGGTIPGSFTTVSATGVISGTGSAAGTERHPVAGVCGRGLFADLLFGSADGGRGGAVADGSTVARTSQAPPVG